MIIGCLFAFSVTGQKEVVSAYNANKEGDYHEAVIYIEQAILIDKAAEKEKTWRYRGSIYLNIAADTTVYAKYPDALNIAKDSYFKARELDVKGRYQKEIIEKLEQIKLFASNKGVECYKLNEYVRAGESFDLALEITKEFHIIDSVLIYSAALSYKMGEVYDKAIERYQDCAEIEYNLPNSYLEAAYISIDLGEIESALVILQNARAKHPNEVAYITEEYNIHLGTDNIDNALGCIITATEMDSTNALYWNLRGTIFNDDKNPEIYNLEKAFDAYDQAYNLNKSLIDEITSITSSENCTSNLVASQNLSENKAEQICNSKNFSLISSDFSNFFNSNYGLGAVYVFYRVQLQEKLSSFPFKLSSHQKQEIKDIKLQMHENEVSAIKHMEIALSINRYDLEVVKALKQLYAAIDNVDKYNEMKKLESSIIKSI